MTEFRRIILEHHDGFGLNDNIAIFADEKDPNAGGASHCFEFRRFEGGATPHSKREDGELLGSIQFQRGPRNVEGSTHGVTTDVVLAVLIDSFESFLAGPFPSQYTATALYHVQKAAEAMQERAQERHDRGVLGFNKE